MELIVDSIEVVTIHQMRTITEDGKHLTRRQIILHGHLSKNLFPFWVFCSAKLPPHEYDLWPAYEYDNSAALTAPISANFVSTVQVTRNYGAMLPGPMPKRPLYLTIEGLYQITLQASWLPLVKVPASEPVFIEVNTTDRNDRDLYWNV